MKVAVSRRFWILSALVSLGFASAMPARADDTLVDSPRYAAWAKFKPESFTTLAMDMKMGPNDIHVEMTRTLKSVTADEVKLTTTTVATAMGHTGNPNTREETIAAKETKQEMKETGEKDVDAMGKTFKCKVIELTGAAAAAMAPQSRAHGPAGDSANAKVILYVCPDVPGGLVKMETTNAMGPMMFIMTAMESK